MKTLYYILLSGLSFLTACNDNADLTKVDSPDKSITIQLFRPEKGKNLYYQVYRNKNGKKVILIDSSKLGLKLGHMDFSNLSIVSVGKERIIDEKYTMVTGKRLENRNFANEKDFICKNEEGKQLKILARAYDDGVAFRYALTDTTPYTDEVIDENTEFSVNPNGKAWIQSYDWWSPAYEKPYENEIWIGKVAPHHREDGWGFPMLFNIEKENWMLITETDLDRNYCACHVRNSDGSPVYKIVFPKKEMGYKGGILNPRIKTPWVSPWRVAIIGDLHTIVESNLVFHLSTPSKISDTKWIKPGRSAWPWAHHFNTKENPELMIKYADLSNSMGWEYLTEANMYCKQPDHLKELLKYTSQRNIGTFFWYNCGVFYDKTGDMSDTTMHNPELRKKELRRIKDLGVKGIKIDFFQSDKQDVIQYYLDLLNETADLNLLILFHGCTVPRGWARTYPNLLSMEAVQGEETYISDRNFPYIVSRQNTILPFTRNVIGSMDYTPCSFSNNVYPHVTSYGHELALSVTFETGILHINDQVEAIRALPDYVKKYFSDLPVTWDDTKFLSGYPGKYFIVARKKGNNWYIGGISSCFEEKDFEVDLSFLGNDRYEISIIKDGTDSQHFDFEKSLYPEKKLLKIKVLSEGGFVIRFTKI